MPSIPNLPGELIERRSERGEWLRQGIAAICRIDSNRYATSVVWKYYKTECYVRFPGSQPVSFQTADLKKLEQKEYALTSTFYLLISYVVVRGG
jgi:hypothetical protein